MKYGCVVHSFTDFAKSASCVLRGIARFGDHLLRGQRQAANSSGRAHDEHPPPPPDENRNAHQDQLLGFVDLYLIWVQTQVQTGVHTRVHTGVHTKVHTGVHAKVHAGVHMMACPPEPRRAKLARRRVHDGGSLAVLPRWQRDLEPGSPRREDETTDTDPP